MAPQALPLFAPAPHQAEVGGPGVRGFGRAGGGPDAVRSLTTQHTQQMRRAQGCLPGAAGADAARVAGAPSNRAVTGSSVPAGPAAARRPYSALSPHKLGSWWRRGPCSCCCGCGCGAEPPPRRPSRGRPAAGAAAPAGGTMRPPLCPRRSRRRRRRRSRRSSALSGASAGTAGAASSSASPPSHSTWRQQGHVLRKAARVGCA